MRSGRARRMAGVGSVLAFALAPTTLVAVVVTRRLRQRRVSLVRRWALEPREEGAARWPSLAAALVDAQETLPSRPPGVTVSLLPPLAQARLLVAPPVSGAAVRALVQHNQRRFFPEGAGTWLCDAVTVGTPRDETRLLLAACAPPDVVGAATDAFAEAGYRTVRLVPAGVALAALACGAVAAAGREARRGRAIAVVASPEWRALAFVEHGEPVALQDTTGVRDDVMETVVAYAAPAAWRGAPAHPCVLALAGDAAAARTLAACALPGTPEAPACEVALPDGVDPADAMLCAAVGAARVTVAPVLGTEEGRAERARRARIGTIRRAGGTVVLLALAAGVHLAAVRRDVSLLAREKAQLAAAASGAIVQRARLHAVAADLEALAAEDAGATRYADVLRAVAHSLPDTAALHSLAAARGELTLAGEGTAARGVLPALGRSPALRDLAWAAPVERDPESGVERFTIRARVPGHPRPDAPAPSRGAP